MADQKTLVEAPEEDIPMDVIYSDAVFNCRGEFGVQDVQDLISTIPVQGLMNAIHVQPFDKIPGYKFRILAGHRRHLACKTLKMPTIRAKVIRGLDEPHAILFNAIENLSRSNLGIMQEAKIVDQLSIMNIGEDEICKKLNKSHGWVQVRKMLLKLPLNVQREVEAGVINQDHIKGLYKARHNPELQASIVRTILDARRKGEKGAINIKALVTKKIEDRKQRRQRHMEEMGAMQDTIRAAYGTNNFTTRVLGWVMGMVSTDELYADLAAEVGGGWTPPPAPKGENTTLDKDDL